MTTTILLITALVSFLGFQNRETLAKLMFNAYLVKHSNQWYRAITHAFIHAGWMHLIVNMWVLWHFGEAVEYSFEIARGSIGKGVFIGLYLGGILFATLPAYRKHQDNFGYNSLGASGAVAAVLFSAIYFNPTMGIYVMFIPIPIPAILFGVVYLIYEWYMDKRSNDNVAHDAHFWGAAFGFVYSVLMVPGQLEYFIDDILFQFM
jgi:membrane associated rhomboid family serine protease